MESRSFVSWEEILVSNEKGRREVHYYLKRSDGGSDLAVVGKERSLRHMSYAAPNLFLRSLRPLSPLRWRSRREVVDWLSSLVTDSHSQESSPSVDRLLDDEDSFPMNDSAFKDLSSGKLKHQSKEFSWIGSSWTCRKRRKHYKSFCRNGITISVHDFVHVMAEENKRLVAYLEDLYEDSRGNNMVMVRWFHKIDEVGIVLPPNHNDREIFFSLCLQDLRVECIDGLATVLNPQHFEKFLNEATHTLCEPYLCNRQFDNDDVKPFDITQLKGYWKQELLRYMYISSSSMNGLKSSSSDGPYLGVDHADATQKRKRKHELKSAETNLNHKVSLKGTSKVVGNSNGSAVHCGVERLVSSSAGSPTGTITSSPRKLVLKQKPQQHLSAGCSVEVLSQDSGMRGCWFRGVIIKRHRDKLKVRYQDVQDADGTGYLEEWILASRVAAPDELGVRMCGRAIVRPYPPQKGGLSMVFDVGHAVDAWCHDGWWEGILIRRESRDKFHVFFPGEQRTSVFSCSDLRRSLDWVCNRWNRIKERPDIANSILTDQFLKSTDGSLSSQVGASEKHPRVENIAHKDMAMCDTSPCSEPVIERQAFLEVPNLAQDNSLAQLKWSSSRKRRRSRESTARRVGSDSKKQCDGSSSSSQEDDGSSACKRFLISKPLTVDHDNCKYEGNDLFSASLPTLSSLVMSQ
ncbi:Bromo adjacent BAH domain-containing protein [Cinnamomum micranthum f. kanehirae]|uniref:Bromo adjacent BAH domain-containing protein n=1 Tax=Cinnamomum micranthum f. kanehirae TaxID=337451 RepID=A0A3S3MJN2_9MAGN|nr:Bromo adjacent BAH domain-containing protein [Cinnamomum micranthum f. kanehirae]